ncbi:hypothetical protein DXG01_017197 [Tephrocybe rancida]|nr:hypothetical protein DXG01_017197 [Tephrocybe rancida]
MLMIPQGDTSNVEGSSDSLPIVLDAVPNGTITKSSFRNLLEVIFPPDIQAEPQLSKQGWIEVLGVADMWEMNKVRQHSIDKLTSLPLGSVERIVLAKKYHVPQWLRSAYSALVDQNNYLTLVDSSEIDYPSAIKIFQLRETRARRNQGLYNYSQGYNYGVQPDLTLEGVFAEEFAAEEAACLRYASADPSSRSISSDL